jgi:AcrR family transcriptional regulator
MSLARKRINPRKLPGQARSRAMVETILDATARVLTKRGFSETTTNAVADQAGISIGSVYQYFPSREALVAAVARRHSERLKGTLEAELTNSGRLPLGAALDHLMQTVAAAHKVDPALNRVLAEELPRLGTLDWKTESGRRGVAMVQAFLDQHRDEVRPDLDDATASFLITTLVEGALNAAYRHGEAAPSGRALLRELTDLIHRYIGR